MDEDRRKDKHNEKINCILLGYSPASEFYVSTFWNTLSIP